MAMTSSRPYLIRALYQWILDNDCTPYLLVNALDDNVEIPRQYIKNDRITLNIAPTIVDNLSLDDNAVQFVGRFNNIETSVTVPMSAIMGIYAHENGQGMVFEPEEQPATASAQPSKKPAAAPKGKKPATSKSKKRGRAKLRLVK